MAEKKLVSTAPFKTLEKKIKYLGVNLTKAREYLYDEYYKALKKKEIEDIKMDKFTMLFYL